MRRHPRVLVAAVRDEALVHRPFHERLADQRGHRLALREVDHLPVTASAALYQGGDDGRRRRHAGDRVAVGDAGLEGDAVAVARERGEAGELLDDRSVGHCAGVRASLPEARHAYNNDVVALLPQPLRPDA